MGTVPYKVQMFIEGMMEKGNEGTLPELIAQREQEMKSKGYVKNKEGFWVKASEVKN